MKTFFNLFLFLLITGFFIHGKAQDIEITGLILDAESKEPIPFANIALKEIYKGTASNDIGEFYFKIDSLPMVLVISHLSYEPVEIEIINDDKLVIELTPGKILMDELVIKGRGNDEFAYKLVSRAYYEIIGKGLGAKYGKTFYRQISKNGDVYSELYEIFYDTKFNSNGVEDWAIQEGRYALKLSTVDSFIYNKNFTLMVRLLTIVQPKTEDLVMPVSSEVREQYYLKTEKIISVNQRKVAIIQFKKKEEVTIPAMEGELWIDVDSHKIFKLIGTIANDKLKFISLKGKSGSWKDYNVTCEIAFKESEDGQLELDYMRLGQNFDYYVNGVFVNKIETRSFLTYYEYYTPPKRKKLGGRLLRFNQRDSDLLDNIGYNQLFWDENIIIKRTPVEAEVISSFEAERAFGSIYLNNRNQLILEDYKLDNDPFIVQVKQKLQKLDMPKVGEKVYLHHDKPFYMAGDKIWFSAYQVNIATNIPTNHDDVLHVNLISPEGNLVISNIFYADGGLCHGQIVIPKDLKSGVYSLEAYSEWMKNFDSRYFYREDLTVINEKDENGLLKKRLTEKANTIIFYPEGGQMVDGLPVQIGFVSRNKFGEAIDIKARLLNQDGRLTSTIKSNYNGLGSIFILPKSDMHYKTMIMSDVFEKVNFPDVKKTGYSIMVNNFKPNSIDISVRGTLNLEGKKFYILVVSKGVLYDRRIGLLTRGIYKTEIPKSNLPSGVAQILLVDEYGILCCKRLVFLNQPETANVKYYQAKKDFKPRERIDLVVEINDENGRALKNANISVSVLDKDKISRNNDARNIRSYFDLDFLLDNKIDGTGELFRDYDRETLKKFDLIMLTQQTALPNIISFDSLERNEKQPLYYKRGLTLTGLAVEKNGSKPLADGFITLISMPDPMLGTWYAKTNKEGRFLLSDLYIVDSTRVLVKAKDGQGNPVDIDLFFDNPKEPLNTNKFETVQIDMENSGKRYLEVRNKAKDLLRSYQISDRIVLEESGFALKISESTYGKPVHVVLFDQKYYAYPDLFEVFLDRFPGVSILDIDGGAKVEIRGERDEPLILLDGVILYDPTGSDEVDLDQSIDNTKYFALENKDVRSILRAINPEIVDRVEVINNESDRLSYPMEGKSGIIAIYTKPGKSPILESISDTMTVKWLPGLTIPEVFVSNDYSRKNETKFVPDMRSTIYWNPGVVTNRRGRVKISFYNSDDAKNLQLCIEGISENGIPIFDIYEIGKKSRRGRGN